VRANAPAQEADERLVVFAEKALDDGGTRIPFRGRGISQLIDVRRHRSHGDPLGGNADISV
jgi:hypothetical protein